MKNIQFLIATLGVLFAKAVCAENDFVVYSPYVVQGKNELEVKAFGQRDARYELNNVSGYNLSVAHAFTSWWKPEVYLVAYNREPGEKYQPSGYEFENTFQLTTQGEYWADLGLLVSYAHNRQPGVSSAAEFELLFEKLSGHFDQRLNLIWGKQIGAGASGAFAFRSSYSLSYNIHDEKASYAPSIEAYYRPGDNAYQIGPVFSGELRTAHGSELEYSLGVIYGINTSAPNKTLLARIAYEFF